MENKRRDRKRNPARRAPSKNPKRRLLIVCEGKVTEPEYFRGFERWARNNTIEIVIPNQHGVPLTLVRRAEKLKYDAESDAKREDDPFLSFDEVWCAFDVDEHPNLNDARQLAVARGIELAVSNPCFELWLWLHFRESPGARHRHDLQRMVRDHLPEYDKHLHFDQVSEGFTDASRRARRLHEDAQAEGEPDRNPTTSVFRLTESIRRNDSVPSVAGR